LSIKLSEYSATFDRLEMQLDSLVDWVNEKLIAVHEQANERNAFVGAQVGGMVATMAKRQADLEAKIAAIDKTSRFLGRTPPRVTSMKEVIDVDQEMEDVAGSVAAAAAATLTVPEQVNGLESESPVSEPSEPAATVPSLAPDEVMEPSMASPGLPPQVTLDSVADVAKPDTTPLAAAPPPPDLTRRLPSLVIQQEGSPPVAPSAPVGPPFSAPAPPNLSRPSPAPGPPCLIRQPLSPPVAPSASSFNGPPDLTRHTGTAPPAPSETTSDGSAHPQAPEGTPPPALASSPLASPKRPSPPWSESTNDEVDLEDDQPRRSVRQRSVVPASAEPMPRPNVRRSRAGSKKPKAG